MLYQESSNYYDVLTTLSVENDNKSECLNILHQLSKIDVKYNSFFYFYEANEFLTAKQFAFVQGLCERNNIDGNLNLFDVNYKYQPKKKKKFKGKKKAKKN